MSFWKVVNEYQVESGFYNFAAEPIGVSLYSMYATQPSPLWQLQPRGGHYNSTAEFTTYRGLVVWKRDRIDTWLLNVQALESNH